MFGDMRGARIGVGYDAVDSQPLVAQIPLWWRGPPISVGGGAGVVHDAELAKRAVEMHALVKDGKWSSRLGKLPIRFVRQDGPDCRLGRIGTRTAKRCLAMEMNVLIYDPYKSAERSRRPL